MTDHKHKPSEHTPGPWRYSKVHGDIISLQAVDSGSDIIADVEGCPHPGPRYIQKRDAALIARAPELLAENERLKEALEVAKCDLFNAGYDPTGEAVCRIESALSRTEPEQGKDGGE